MNTYQPIPRAAHPRNRRPPAIQNLALTWVVAITLGTQCVVTLLRHAAPNLPLLVFHFIPLRGSMDHVVPICLLLLTTIVWPVLEFTTYVKCAAALRRIVTAIRNGSNLSDFTAVSRSPFVACAIGLLFFAALLALGGGILWETPRYIATPCVLGLGLEGQKDRSPLLLGFGPIGTFGVLPYLSVALLAYAACTITQYRGRPVQEYLWISLTPAACGVVLCVAEWTKEAIFSPTLQTRAAVGISATAQNAADVLLIAVAAATACLIACAVFLFKQSHPQKPTKAA